MPAILRCSNPWRTMWLPRASSKHRLLDCAVVKRSALAAGSVAERLVRGVVVLMQVSRTLTSSCGTYAFADGQHAVELSSRRRVGDGEQARALDFTRGGLGGGPARPLLDGISRHCELAG